MSTLLNPTAVEAGVLWFAGLGFRPAVWTPPHRADEVDPDRVVVAPDADAAYAVKYDGPLTDAVGLPGHGWGTWLPQPDAAQITAASLAGPIAGPQPGSPWHPLTPWGPGNPSWPHQPTYPCCAVPPVDPLPPVAPVPVSADAALFLMTALAVLTRRKFA